MKTPLILAFSLATASLSWAQAPATPRVAQPALPPPSQAPAPLSLAPPPPANTNFWDAQLRTTKRVVSGRTLDIAPLVNWYREPGQSERPLRAWVFVTGKLEAPSAYGWKISGAIDNASQPRPFLLKNPPTESMAEFNRLKQNFDALLRRHAALTAELESAQSLLERTQEAYRAGGYIRYGGDLLNRREDTVRQIRADIAAVSADVQSMDALGHNLRGDFVVRCFAVKTGQVFNGMAVYDHGYVLR